jgi:hypothetical protein
MDNHRSVYDLVGSVDVQLGKKVYFINQWFRSVRSLLNPTDLPLKPTASPRMESQWNLRKRERDKFGEFGRNGCHWVLCGI